MLLGVTLAFTIYSFHEQKESINTPIMYVKDMPITELEYAFYYVLSVNTFQSAYYNYLEILNLDISSNLSNQKCYFEGYDTWSDFFTQITLMTIQENKAMYLESKNAGFIYDSDSEYQLFRNQIKEQAEKNNVPISEMYKILYGNNATERIIKEYALEYYTAHAYENYILDNVEITDKEMEEEYEKNKINYMTITYRYFTINAEVNTEMSTEEIENAMSIAKENAEDFLAHVDNEASFIELSIDYLNDNSNTYFYENMYYDDTPFIIRDWLFSCSEKNQVTYIVDDSSYSIYVVYYISSNIDNNTTVTIRHILITPQISDVTSYLPTEEDYKEAYEEAIKIRDEWEAGERTEYSFAELAKQYSDDVGSLYNGGLISNIYNGQFDDELNKWLFESDRRVGDIEVLKSTYGYHVVYFVDNGEPVWLSNIRTNIKNEKSKKIINEMVSMYPITSVE